MALKPLKVRITGDTTQLENALGRAGRNLKGFAVAAGAAGALVAGALSAMTVQGLKSVDALTKLSRSMGATANGLRAVQIAAGYAGVSVEEVNTSLQSMNRELASAAEVGSPAEKALRKIGLRASDLANLDADKRLALIADRIKAVGLSSGESADLLRDLGVRGRNMSLLLMSGSEAIASAREEVDKFGLALTDAQTSAIESANDSLSRMTLVFEGLRNKLAVEVAPVLQSLADRFNTLASSGAVQGAIERLVAAFGSLADIILSEDFINVAVSGLELIASTAAGAAELMVTFSQNIEMVTVAFSGLAIALAVAGGPLTLIVGALAVALVGIAKWRGKAEDAAKGSDAFAEAQEKVRAGQVLLNEQLGIFADTAAPGAGQAAISLANDNYKLAASAVAAARAEVAKNQAVMDAEVARIGAINSALGEGEYPELGTILGASVDTSNAQARLDALTQMLNETEAQLNATSVTVTGSAYSGAGSPLSRIRPPKKTDPDEDDTGLGGGAIPGLGGAGAVTDQLAGRLEALQQGLATEREFLLEWYEEGKATLEDALENELLTHEEYIAAKTALDEEYYQKKMSMDQAASQHEIEMKRRTVDGVIGLIGSMGKKSEKLAKVAVALNAAKAISETIQNTAAASVRALAELGPIAGPPAAARIKAYGATQVALIGANAVLSSGGGGGGGGSSAAASGASAAPMPTQNVQIDLVGATPSQVDAVQNFADLLNEARRQGFLTNITVAG